MTISLTKSIQTDIKFNRTPDLPVLRYRGSAISVFLWDENQDFTSMCTVLEGLDIPNVYQSKFFKAVTKDSYVPWYNLNNEYNAYPAYCLSNPKDIELMDGEEWYMDEPQPIRGKVVDFSLEALIELDLFYENQGVFTRQLIEVYPTSQSSQTIRCFTWFNHLADIADYNLSKDKYILKKGIDLCTFMSGKTPDNKPVYKM